jgi:hypothetical protein
MSTSREYAKFKRTFVGPKLKRKQRIALMPPMPAKKLPYSARPCKSSNYVTVDLPTYKGILFAELSPEDLKKALWSEYIVQRRKKRDKSMPPWADKKAIQSIYILKQDS